MTERIFKARRHALYLGKQPCLTKNPLRRIRDLPMLMHDAAIAWGGFFFEFKQEDDEEEWKVLDDDKMPKCVGRKQSVGASSEAYAPRSAVFVTEVSTGATQEVAVVAANHAVVRGLKPDTEYSYRVVVREAGGHEREWAVRPLHDCVIVSGERLMRAARHNENRFRTFPAPAMTATSLTFAVIGDFGR